MVNSHIAESDQHQDDQDQSLMKLMDIL